MKSAEEWAAIILKGMVDKQQQQIASLLQSGELMADAIREARNEALEEAAKESEGLAAELETAVARAALVTAASLIRKLKDAP